jgi:serine/threonine protein kinase
MLSDRVLDHLRGAIEAPDLSGTRYELMEEIGRGGMGIVYRAQDKALRRAVALKILNSGAEAQILAALEHPGVVPVHDAGTLPDGRAYYAMKYVKGTRLDDYRATAPSLASRLRTFLSICEPVAFAHSLGVIHRDLKPENIMIGAFGEVLVLDWGSAGGLDAIAITSAGTRGYMAPEQADGITTAQTDIYSLGKVLQYLLHPADQRPVQAIAARACHADAALRYSSILELTEEIARFLDNQPVRAYRESPVERAARWFSGNKTLSILIATYVLLRAVIFFFTRR